MSTGKIREGDESIMPECANIIGAVVIVTKMLVEPQSMTLNAILKLEAVERKCNDSRNNDGSTVNEDGKVVITTQALVFCSATFSIRKPRHD